MKNFHKINLIILFTFTLVFSQELGIEWKHPKQESKLWFRQVEIAFNTEANAQVTILDSTFKADEAGLYRHVYNLETSDGFIPVRLESKGKSYEEILHVYFMINDEKPDSIYINNNIPSDGHIHFVYPQNDDLFYGNQVGLRAYTHPKAEVYLEGNPIPVFPSGALTTVLQFNKGVNTFVFTSLLNDVELSDTLTITQPEPHQSDARKEMWPNSRNILWRKAGSNLPIKIYWEKSKKLSFRIKGLTNWIKFNENLFNKGEYLGEILLPLGIEPKTYVIQFRDDEGLFSRKLPKRYFKSLKIMDHVYHGRTSVDDSRVYDQEDGNQLILPLNKDIDLAIEGRVGHYYRVLLDENRHGYININQVEIVSHNPPPIVTLGSLEGQIQEDWEVYRMSVGSNHPPYEIREYLNPTRVELTFYGAKQGWEWTKYAEENDVVETIERYQVSDRIWKMTFTTKNKQLWGWYGHYEGDFFVVGIRKPPVINPTAVFEGIRFEIDPGHGGWERGALGVSGYGEADANLRYTMMIKRLLEDAGATVFMTREDDRQLSLNERAEKSVSDSIHIFIMAHNNAPATSTDLMTVRGSSTYYTWPSSKPLCDTTYPYLLGMGLPANGKVTRYYYYLTRQTEYLIFLIEGGYMTHPDDELFLLSNEGLDALANATVNGIQDFLKSQIEKKKAN